MAKPIIEQVTSKNAVVIYQQVDDGVGEPALLVEYWSGMIGISQEGATILINKETVSTLCNLLKKPLE